MPWHGSFEERTLRTCGARFSLASRRAVCSMVPAEVGTTRIASVMATEVTAMMATEVAGLVVTLVMAVTSMVMVVPFRVIVGGGHRNRINAVRCRRIGCFAAAPPRGR
jgi:hypothetical protein